MIGLRRFNPQALIRPHRIGGGFRNLSVPRFKGRATVNGTFDFIRKSGLPLHHKFSVSELTISPIIHGPPSQHTLQTHGDNKPYIEALTRRAVVMNRSNCVVVYQHYPDDKPYFATNLHVLFTDPKNEVSRDQVVIVAHIGLATTRSEVFKRLSDACQQTGMEMIDMAMFEINESVDEAHIEDTISALDTLCQQGMLQSFGIQVSVAPYTYHKPAHERRGPIMGMPFTVEDIYMKHFDYADIVAYPISPSIAYPSTYPMLDPNPEECDNPEFLGDSTEKNRTFTRMALNPLTCMVGGRENVKYDNSSVLEGRRRFRAKQLEQEIAEARAKIVKAMKKKTKREAARGEDYQRTEEDDMADELARMNEQGLQKLINDLSEQQQKQQDPHEDLYRERSPGESEDTPRIMDIVGTDLVTGLNAPALEEFFVDALDELCPPLVSTPLLQDKALRVVLSVGIDVVVVDAERSAQLGKFAIKPADLLTSQQTDDVFEYFKIPFGDERDAEDPYFQDGTGDMEAFESDEDDDEDDSDGDEDEDDDDSEWDTDFDSEDISDKGDDSSDDPDFDSDAERKKRPSPGPKPVPQAGK